MIACRLNIFVQPVQIRKVLKNYSCCIKHKLTFEKSSLKQFNMKHLKTLSFIFCVLVLAACSSSTSTNTDNDKLSTSNNFAITDDTTNVTTINKISFNTASAYVYEYINQFPTQATNNGISGYFSRHDKDSDFNSSDSSRNNVNLIQYCYDSSNSREPLFFALCKTDSANPNGINLPDASFSIKSRANQKFFIRNPNNTNLSDSSLAGVITYLENHNQLPADGNVIQLKQKDINIKRSEFLKHFSIIDSLQKSVPANKFAYGVINHAEMDSLMRQSLETDNDSIIGFRCYFGFNKEERTNKIRLIVFAVGANGKNLCRKSDGRTDYLILDKAWP